MHTTYYIATATYQNHRHVFVYKPGKPGTLTERKETVEELERSAAEKGFEVSYAYIFGSGIPWSLIESVVKLVAPIMREAYPERTLPQFPDASYLIDDTFIKIRVPEAPPSPFGANK